MKKIGRGTKPDKPQFLHQGLTIFNYTDKTEETIAAIIRNRVVDFERTHDNYKFDKLIFGFDDPGPHQHFDIKFIYEK